MLFGSCQDWIPTRSHLTPSQGWFLKSWNRKDKKGTKDKKNRDSMPSDPFLSFVPFLLFLFGLLKTLPEHGARPDTPNDDPGLSMIPCSA